METLNNEKTNEIIIDIINHLNNELDCNNLENHNNLLHIDNLRDEIKENPDNFNYSIDEFNFILNQFFN